MKGREEEILFNLRYAKMMPDLLRPIAEKLIDELFESGLGTENVSKQKNQKAKNDAENQFSTQEAQGRQLSPKERKVLIDAFISMITTVPQDSSQRPRVIERLGQRIASGEYKNLALEDVVTAEDVENFLVAIKKGYISAEQLKGSKRGLWGKVRNMLAPGGSPKGVLEGVRKDLNVKKLLDGLTSVEDRIDVPEVAEIMDEAENPQAPTELKRNVAAVKKLTQSYKIYHQAEQDIQGLISPDGAFEAELLERPDVVLYLRALQDLRISFDQLQDFFEKMDISKKQDHLGDIYFPNFLYQGQQADSYAFAHKLLGSESWLTVKSRDVDRLCIGMYKDFKTMLSEFLSAESEQKKAKITEIYTKMKQYQEFILFVSNLTVGEGKGTYGVKLENQIRELSTPLVRQAEQLRPVIQIVEEYLRKLTEREQKVQELARQALAAQGQKTEQDVDARIARLRIGEDGERNPDELKKLSQSTGVSFDSLTGNNSSK